MLLPPSTIFLYNEAHLSLDLPVQVFQFVSAPPPELKTRPRRHLRAELSQQLCYLHFRLVIDSDPSSYFPRKHSHKSGFPHPVLLKSEGKNVPLSYAILLVFSQGSRLSQIFRIPLLIQTDFLENILSHLIAYKHSSIGHLGHCWEDWRGPLHFNEHLWIHSSLCILSLTWTYTPKWNYWVIKYKHFHFY